MKRASSLFARAGAICTSLALTLSLFPASAFADDPQTNNFTDTWQNQSRISITSPIALVFGADGNGWDKGSTKMPTAVGTFKNTGDTPVFIQRVQYLPVQQENEDNNAFTKNVEDAVSAVTISDRCKYGAVSKQTIDASSTDGELMQQAITLAPNTSTKLDYELTLHEKDGNNNDLIKSTAYDGGQTAWPIGKIKYIFEAANFWLTDLRDENDPKTYTLNEVKAQALKVADLTDTSDEAKYWRDMYYQFATYATINPTTPGDTGKDGHDGRKNYTCGIKLGSPYNKFYDLRILGTNQDELVTYNNGVPAPSGKYAGVTFMFGEAVTMAQYWNHPNYSIAVIHGAFKGWGDTVQDVNNPYRLYNAMQKTSRWFDSDKFSAIYDALGASDIKNVYKYSAIGESDINIDGKLKTNPNYEPTAHTNTANQLFVLSTGELGGCRGGYEEHSYNDSNTWIDAEVYPVAYDGFVSTNGLRTGQYQYFGPDGLGVSGTYRFVTETPINRSSVHPANGSTKVNYKFSIPNRSYEELIMKYNSQPVTWWGRTQCGCTATRGSGVSSTGTPQFWWAGVNDFYDGKDLGNLQSLTESTLFFKGGDPNAMACKYNDVHGVVPCFCL